MTKSIDIYFLDFYVEIFVNFYILPAFNEFVNKFSESMEQTICNFKFSKRISTCLTFYY